MASEPSLTSSSSLTESTQDPNADPDRIFEVEAIKDCYTDCHGVTRFTVKWKGYDESENTVESFDNLSGCHKLLKNTLVTKGKTKQFKVNASAHFSQKYNEAFQKALLEGSDKNSSWKSGWPKVMKAEKLKVIGQLKVDDEEVEYIVLFDKHNLACFTEKKLVGNYGHMAQLAICHYLERVLSH